MLTPPGVSFGSEDLRTPEVHLHLTEPGCHTTSMFCHTEIAPSSLVAPVCTDQGGECLLTQPQPTGNAHQLFPFHRQGWVAHKLHPLSYPPSFFFSVHLEVWFHDDCFLEKQSSFLSSNKMIVIQECWSPCFKINFLFWNSTVVSSRFFI